MTFETIHIKNRKGFQAINIPEKMRINDDKVYLKKVGHTLQIIPFHNPWQNLIESLDLFTPDFMENREQPSHQTRETFD
jgi:antitoxin VapB